MPAIVTDGTDKKSCDQTFREIFAPHGREHISQNIRQRSELFGSRPAACEDGRVFMPEINYLNVWTFPVTGPDAPADAPTNVVGACLAVGRDLQCRWHGPDTYIQNCLWTVSLVEDDYCHLRLDAGPRPRCKTTGTTTLKSVGFGGVHITQSVQELTVLIAGEMQDQLAGGMPFVQWPIDGQRLLTASLRDGRPSWVVRSSDRVVADIGALCAR